MNEQKFLSSSAFKTKNVVLFISLLFFILALFMEYFLDYKFMRADVLSYWEESLRWKIPYNEHPPLYALTIAFLRAITLNLINPVILMMAINLVALIGCVYFIIHISLNAGTSQYIAALNAITFSIWPLVGLTYTVIPLADIPAIALTLAGLYFLQKNKSLSSGILLGLALITHKGVWPIIGLIVVAYFFQQKTILSKANVLMVLFMLLPVMTLWIAGSFHHNSINWFMARSIEVNTTAESGFRILGGLVDTIQLNEPKELLSGLIGSFFLVLAIGVLIYSFRYRYVYFEIAIAISLSIIIMFLFSSSGTIWGPVRFSRFLNIPLFLAINYHHDIDQPNKKTRVSMIIVAAILIISQLIYAWYVAKIFS